MQLRVEVVYLSVAVFESNNDTELDELTTRTEYALGKVIKVLHGHFVHVGKTSTDLQILGGELHQNAFGGRDPPGPAGRV